MCCFLRREENLIVKEIIGLSVGEVALPVLVGVLFNETSPYSLMVAMFAMAVIISVFYYTIEYLVLSHPTKDRKGVDGVDANPLLENDSLQ